MSACLYLVLINFHKVDCLCIVSEDAYVINVCIYFQKELDLSVKIRMNTLFVPSLS